jgi:hypothetical protein
MLLPCDIMLLPLDIIDRIFASVAINELKTGTQATLASCSRVSHSFHDWATVHLYRHVHTNHACKILFKRRDLAKLVHSAEFELADADWNLPGIFDDELEEMDGPTLALQPQPKMLRDLGLGDDVIEDIRAGDGRALVTAVLRVLPNLQALKLMVMDSLGRYVDILKPSPSAGTPSLTNVHLRYCNGTDEDDPILVFDAFMIPTIHTLTITTFRGSQKVASKFIYSKGTSTVKHLTMEGTAGNANLHTQWLYLPEALTSLTSDISVMALRLRDLQRSRLTLRSLVLYGDYSTNHAHIVSLADFPFLEHVEVPLNALLRDDADAERTTLADRLPKSVRSLSLRWSRCISFNTFRIQVLEVVASHPLYGLMLRSAPKANDDNQRRMYEDIQSACESAGVKWSVVQEYGH